MVLFMSWLRSFILASNIVLSVYFQLYIPVVKHYRLEDNVQLKRTNFCDSRLKDIVLLTRTNFLTRTVPLKRTNFFYFRLEDIVNRSIEENELPLLSTWRYSSIDKNIFLEENVFVAIKLNIALTFDLKILFLWREQIICNATERRN